jgi:suppressor for copper-sensitivity B
MKMSTLKFSLIVGLLFGLTGSPSVSATESSWNKTEQTSLRLISATTNIGERDRVTLGLQFKLKPHWKIYWRSPGDAGFPPRPKFDGSQNLKSASLSWPAPKRFSVLGFETLGYTDEVVFPLTAILKQPGKPLKLNASIDYLACEKICIPYTAKLALNVPGGTGQATPNAHLISRFQAQVPGDGTAHGLAIEGAEVVRKNKKTILRINATSSLPFEKPDVYLEGPPELVFSAPKVQVASTGNTAMFDVQVDGIADLKGGLKVSSLTATLVDGKRSAERGLTVLQTPIATIEEPSLLLILGLALLGGLILNLMPCVLPVLSIKLLGVVGHGGGEKRTVRLSFLASAAGIVAAFMVLAGALAILKSGGAAIGWGIQFQHPWFLIAMTVVISLFACNLWGWFEVRLPAALSDLGGVGHTHSMGGHFLSGVLATLLATPCSAPFLGTAVGFALSRATGDIFVVFSALGVGLALPYLLIAALPGLATRLPRPGPWMITLKKILALALVATAVWLLSVLQTSSNETTAKFVGLLMAIIAMLFFLRTKVEGGLHQKAGLAIAALIVFALATPSFLPGSKAPQAQATIDDKGIWKPFDEAVLHRLVATGKTVFVDVTAEWCITCQVNKSLVLSNDDIWNRLQSGKVVAMRADWTRPSDVIANYLARHGRYAIPFNIVYGPANPKGILLPEILTPSAVLEAMNTASVRAVAKTQ